MKRSCCFVGHIHTSGKAFSCGRSAAPAGPRDVGGMSNVGGGAVVDGTSWVEVMERLWRGECGVATERCIAEIEVD